MKPNLNHHFSKNTNETNLLDDFQVPLVTFSHVMFPVKLRKLNLPGIIYILLLSLGRCWWSFQSSWVLSIQQYVLRHIQCLLVILYPHSQRGGYIAITLSVRPLVCPSVHTFVTDISASTGRNDCTSTSCLPCNLQMDEWGYSQHDVACNILFCLKFTVPI